MNVNVNDRCNLKHPLYTKFTDLHSKLGCDLVVRPHHDGRLDKVYNQRQAPLSFHPHARNFPTDLPDAQASRGTVYPSRGSPRGHGIVFVRRGLPSCAIGMLCLWLGPSVSPWLACPMRNYRFAKFKSQARYLNSDSIMGHQTFLSTPRTQPQWNPSLASAAAA